MTMTPRISVVTSSFNQGKFIGRTIASVLAQNDPNVEHLVVDGMSTDDTPAVLARYPHLRVIREPDRGQADAVNKGFRAATGDILCFLNSDDTLAPGALERVRQEIDPGRGRHVVVGRCRYIDEADRFVGREHPSEAVGPRRILEVWKGHPLPQPATFWTREVWQRCGPLNEGEQLVLDYDFFCRISRHYRFHWVDQVLANYRLHAASKTCSAQDERVREESIRVSKRYWGPAYRLPFWQLLLSYAAFRLDRRGRALRLWQLGRQAVTQQRWLTAAARYGLFTLLAPDLFANLVVWPGLAMVSPMWFERLGLARRFRPRTVNSRTRAWLAFTGRHVDGWVGPRFETDVMIRPGDGTLRLTGATDFAHLPEALSLELFLDGKPLGKHPVGRRPTFELSVPLPRVALGVHVLRVEANTFVTHHDYRGSEDFRPLSFQVRRLGAEGRTSRAA